MAEDVVELDLDSKVPPYEQIRVQLISMISGGILNPGEQLPTVRDLAGDLRVAPGTVARVYRELEDAGWVVTAGRRGTTVAMNPPVAAQPPRSVVQAALHLREVARKAEYPSAALMDYLRKLL